MGVMRDFRQTISAAVVDDLMHGQPEFDHRDAYREGRTIWEVRGFIDPAKLGIFGAEQLVKVIERMQPGTLAKLNGQPTTITEADVLAALAKANGPNDVAAALNALIAERLALAIGFDDL